MAETTEQYSGATATPEHEGGKSEEEMRAAYEAELNRITSSEMIIQTAVSLINIGGRRLGLAPPSAENPPPTAERDLEQVRDAIDGASALLPILERRMPSELGPLRDAIAQLQVAYAREAQSSAREAQSSSATGPAKATTTAASGPKTEPVKPTQSGEGKPLDGDGEQAPGPAQASGRLWVPGR